MRNSKKRTKFFKKKNEAHRLIIVFFNELKNFEIDIIRFEREKTILNFDLNEVARRRNAILTKIFENSKIDVIIKKAFDEKKKNMKKKKFSTTQTSNRRTKTFVIFVDRTRFVQMYFKKRFTILFEIFSYFSNKNEFS